MAFLPCYSCEQRFKGPVLYVYAQTFEKDRKESYRYPVCPDCFASIMDPFRRRALYRDPDGDWCEPDDSDGEEGHWIDTGQPTRLPWERK